MFYPVTTSTRTRTPHQNVSMGVLEGWNWTQGLLMDYWLSLGMLGVQLTDVTRKTRTTRRTPPKLTISKHTKNLIEAHRRCLPIFFFNLKFFWDGNFCFHSKFYFGRKIFFDPNFFFRPKISFWLKICFGHKILLASKYFRI